MRRFVDTGYKELDKLEDYLIKEKIPYTRKDDEMLDGWRSWHQIKVFKDEDRKKSDEYWWDAICHYGSYGYEEGLLEVMGEPVVREDDDDSVCGYLTAEDVINRFEEFVGRSE